MKRPLLILALLPVLLLAIGACPKPRPQNDPWRTAAVAAADFAAAVKGFQDSEIILHRQGLIASDEHQAIQRVLLDVARAGKQLDQAIRAAHQRPEASAAVDAALIAAQQLLDEGVLHVKNPNARARLSASLALARIALDTIRAVLAAQPRSHTKRGEAPLPSLRLMDRAGAMVSLYAPTGDTTWTTAISDRASSSATDRTENADSYSVNRLKMAGVSAAVGRANLERACGGVWSSPAAIPSGHG